MSRGLPHNVKQCLEKSRDCALLAIETYNKPAIKFRYTKSWVSFLIEKMNDENEYKSLFK